MKKSPSSSNLRRIPSGISLARTLVLPVSLMVAFGQSAQAATYTWNGGSNGALWSESANWSSTALVASTSSDLVFSGTTNTLTTDNLAAASNFRHITFSLGAGPFVLGGNSIILNGNVFNNGWSTQTIDLNIDQAGAVRTYTTGVVGPVGTTNYPVLLGDLVINGVISNGGLTKTSAATFGPNAGKLTLTGVNTYTGVTTISRGTLSVSTIGNGGVAGNLGAASNAASNLVFSANGALQYTGVSASTDRNFTISTGGTATFDIKANNLTLTGASTATNGALAKTGLGTLTLTRAMLNTGATNVSGGKLALDFTASGAPTSQILNSGNALAFSTTALALGDTRSATLEVIGGTVANTQTFGALTVGNLAAHLNLVGGTAAAPITVNIGSIASFTGAAGAAPMMDIQKGASDVVNFTSSTGVFNTNGTFSGNNATVGVTLNGTDWAALSGVNTGSVITATYTTGSGSAGYGGANNVNVVASGTQNAGANTLRFDAAAPIALTYSASNTTKGILVTKNVGANSIVINGSSPSIGLSAGNRSLVIFQNNTLGDLTISGIQDGSSAGNYAALAKAGEGRLILSGTNKYNANTYVYEGALQISNNSNIGGIGKGYINAPQGYSLVLGATLEARGGSNIVLDGLGGVSGIYAHPLMLGNGTPVIDVDEGTTLTISGGINPVADASNFLLSGALTKNNTGTLVLTGVNNSSGGLIVNAGTVRAAFSSAGVTVPTGTAQAVGWSSGTGVSQLNFTAGSTTINCLNASTAGVGGGALSVGQLITGTGLAAGTTITAVSGSTITISSTTTAANSGSYNVYLNATSASFASGATSITVGSATGIQVGQLVTGTGIDTGAVVTGISGNTVTLNLPTTAVSGAGTQYTFGGLNQYAVSSTNGLTLGYASQGIGQGLSGYINGIQGNIVTDSNTNSQQFGLTNLVFGAADSLGTGFVTVNGGTLDLGGVAHQPIGAVTLTGGAISNGTLQGTSYTAAIGSGTTATVSANLAGSSSVGFNKSGAGTVVLSGANTYKGATTISGGKLAVNGSLAAGSAVTVETGGILGGSGTMGAVSVNSGGHFAPGNSITTTFTASSVTLKAGSVSDFELGTASATRLAANSSLTNDRTTVTGALNLGGALNLIDNGNAGGLGSAGVGSYLLFTGASAVSGSFSSVNNIAGLHTEIDTETAGNVYVDLNYYADPVLFGDGAFSDLGNNKYSLNLGAFNVDTGIHTASITLSNAMRDMIYQDILGGTFDLSGANGFSLEGFENPILLGIGADQTLTFTFDTTGKAQDTYTGHILFNPTSTNATSTENISQIDIALEFQAVPEPSTWAMIVGGFGMLLGVQRLRKHRVGA